MSNEKNRDWYQRSFNSLHLSAGFREKLNESRVEGKGMNMTTRTVYGFSHIAAAAVMICTLAFGSAGICYAYDVGGFRTNLMLWLNGTKQSVEVERVDENTYKMTNENGEELNLGGTVIDDDGNSTSLDAGEIVSYMNSDGSLTEKDGRMIFSYKSITEDVTDMIDDSGRLYIHVKDTSNPDTYFNFSGIKGRSYECQADSDPAPGAEYYEADSSGLVNDGQVPQGSGADTYQTTVVTSD